MGEVIGRLKSGMKRYYHMLGSVRMVVTASGVILEARYLCPFGTDLPGRSNLSATAARQRFTGKERDVESTLDYFGARYYLAPLGRWLMPDPLADAYPGHSPYNYALNNPVRFTDPTGLCPIDYVNETDGAVCKSTVVEDFRSWGWTVRESDLWERLMGDGPQYAGHQWARADGQWYVYYPEGAPQLLGGVAGGGLVGPPGAPMASGTCIIRRVRRSCWGVWRAGDG